MNKSNTRRSLIASLIMLALCFTSLIGTTFAWFTDSVTSAGNVIQSGTLKVEMYWADGTEDPDAANWIDASAGATLRMEGEFGKGIKSVHVARTLPRSVLAYVRCEDGRVSQDDEGYLQPMPKVFYMTVR